MRDSQKWKRVELRAAQQFSRKREKEDDPDIGLPETTRELWMHTGGTRGRQGNNNRHNCRNTRDPRDRYREEAAERGGVSVPQQYGPQHHGQRGRGDHSPGP